jgi:hypothetical protein
LQLDIGRAACGESRRQPLFDRRRSPGARFRALNPCPRAPTQQKAKARRDAATIAGAAWGFARMFPSIQRDVELICLRCQAFIARIAAAKSSTHIH